MKIAVVDGERVEVHPRRTLGAGGEATVVLVKLRGRPIALKLFHAPSEEKARKVERLIALRGRLPAETITPTALAYDELGTTVIGYAMPALDAQYEPVALLGVRSFRRARSVGWREIALVLAAMARVIDAVHEAGALLGDLNDQNELFGPSLAVRFIDTDSWDIGDAVGTVATEAFLDPAIYGADSCAPCIGRGRFSLATDAYAFAVLAFRSLTGVHPYGGVDPDLSSLPARARARRSVFDTRVALPPRARESVALLPRDLALTFRAMFDGTERSLLRAAPFEALATEIVRCRCGHELPASRLPCSHCTTRSGAGVPSTIGVDATEILATSGAIVAVVARHEGILVVELTRGGLCLREPTVRGGVTRALGVPRCERGFELASSELGVTIFARGESEGWFFDAMERTLTTLAADRGQGSAAAVLTRSSRWRVARGHLLETRGARGDERVVATVAIDQTRLGASAESDIVVLSERSFGEHGYRAVVSRGIVDLEVPKLRDGEALEAEELVTSEHEVAVLRRTSRAGKTRVRSSWVRLDGPLVVETHHADTEAASREAGPAVAGGILSAGRYLVATDRGLVREPLSKAGGATTFPETAPFVTHETPLFLSSRGLLVATADRLFALKLSAR